MIGSAEPTRRRKMLVICPFPQGVAAGQRLKYEQYFNDWRRLGYDIEVSSYMDPSLWQIVYEKNHHFRKVAGTLKGHIRRIRDMFRLRRYDLVYVFMWVTPFGTKIFERLTRLLARRMIFDVEDNVILDSATARHDSANPLARMLKGPGKARYLIRTADHVITSSPSLSRTCEGISERGPCTYISSSVDTDRFVPAPPRASDAPVVIGWTGTFSSRPYLDTLRDIFQRLTRKVDFRLRVIGNFDWTLPGVDLEVVRWAAEREVEDLQAIDIGVYPLTNDDWVSGKSGLKAIQYMAVGLPTVATRVGTTPLIIHHGENGLLVTDGEGWLEALEALVRDPDLRRRLGTAARQDAVAKYSTYAIAAEYRRVLAKVMGAEE